MFSQRSKPRASTSSVGLVWVVTDCGPSSYWLYWYLFGVYEWNPWTERNGSPDIWEFAEDDCWLSLVETGFEWGSSSSSSSAKIACCSFSSSVFIICRPDNVRCRDWSTVVDSRSLVDCNDKLS